ncbi:hypothetical protein J4E91_010651 [Alternaria rosae]|uniref:uncharacterized protein n=1 Tax=Alternaria rosae TaxID=1187941 RepID=UPI001E8E52A5|nr:uncharacterized protein BKA58DRAFT_415206 [Alternaria rosae]KAH6851405.1 hypothetical protein BKA58DRAFT_415206 [Alternaria rosae]KAI4941620.1 hypothetical protein J4E91_010651 [Alternaria rosae]
MKYTVAITTLVASAMATAISSDCPKPSATATATGSAPSSTASGEALPTGYFGVISSRSASPIHLQSLTARGGKFYLGGGPPSSYCPPNIPAEACPAGNTTVLAGGQGTLALGVVVPGGQEVYVAPGGALQYTVAHSVSKPEGSDVTGFSRTAPANGNVYGYLDYETGFVACPAGEGEGYQVFGAVEDGEFGDDCLGFTALAVATDDAGAWQY